MNNLQIFNIDNLPRGKPIEKPLCPKRKRLTWDPNVEYGSSTSSTSARSPVHHSLSKRPCPKKSLADKDIDTNYGSESEDSHCEDDDCVPLLKSRVHQGELETPLDENSEPSAIFIQEPPNVLYAREAEGAMQPTDFFHFMWRPFPHPPIPPKKRRERFVPTSVGPTEKCKDPYDIFVSIWDAPIMEHIASETNKYAQDVVLRLLHDNKLGHRSRICDWKDTCVDELYTYFSIIMAMGVVIKTKIEEYWNTTLDIFSTPGFNIYMNLSRFQLLNACLHFNDNRILRDRQLSPTEAKLFKIEPIINHLNSKFQSLYTLSQNIALDESLMQWKGLLGINQFIPNKVAKVGVKTYELCESQTGYLWRFYVHPNKKPSEDPPNLLDAPIPNIVLGLLRGLEGMGYTVWMDNFYNSPALARVLKVLGFDVVGTLRTNRQFVPQELKELSKENMSKGQIAGFTSGDVDVMVWRDENRVAMISTYHGNQTSEYEGKVKPCLILDYNIMMGGVDKKDQLLSMYPIERKRTYVWYKKVFRRLLNVSVLNSYIIARKSGCTLDHRRFRKTLIMSLLNRHRTTKPMHGPSTLDDKFLAKTHHLLEYQMGVNKSRLRRKCCVCSKRTHFYCAGCEKTVCISTCFVSLHSHSNKSVNSKRRTKITA